LCGGGPHIHQQLAALRKEAGFGRLLSSTSSNPPLHNFYRFLQDLTGYKLVAMNLDWPISDYYFQVPANFFFIVMTTGQELGR
jgi:hypothetical protein